jgi:hypothetical protein
MLPIINKEWFNATKKGLSCLKKYRPIDSRKLSRILSEDKPTLIYIGTSSEVEYKTKIVKLSKGMQAASFFDEFKEPVLAMRIDKTKKFWHKELRRTLFHEMLHWLGYSHFKGVDIPYIVDSCCFTNSQNINSQQLACKLLASNADWTSIEYSRDFTTIMQSSKGRGFIALRSAWNIPSKLQSFDSLFETTKVLAKITLNRKPHKRRESSSALLSLIFSTALREHLSLSKRRFLTQEIEQPFKKMIYNNNEVRPILEFSEYVGKIISGIISKNNKDIIDSWQKLKQIKHRACGMLTWEEKWALKDATELTYLRLTELRPPLKIDIYKNWTNICF